MRGWAAYWEPPTKESTSSARDYFGRAIKIDPQNFEAMVGLAATRLRAWVLGLSTAADHAPLAQMELVRKATAINPRYAVAHNVRSFMLFLSKQFLEAMEAACTAVALDPNSPYAYAMMGRAEAVTGRCEQSIAHTNRPLP
jgi:hypothetical protein